MAYTYRGTEWTPPFDGHPDGTYTMRLVNAQTQFKGKRKTTKKGAPLIALEWDVVDGNGVGIGFIRDYITLAPGIPRAKYWSLADRSGWTIPPVTGETVVEAGRLTQYYADDAVDAFYGFGDWLNRTKIGTLKVDVEVLDGEINPYSRTIYAPPSH